MGSSKKEETTNKDSGVVSETALHYTKNFDDFVLMRGNRKVVDKHARSLMKRMQEQGNLTTHFPIIVNEKMEVIDGQHRLEALKRLNAMNAKNPDGEIIWTPFYRVEVGLTTDSIRHINNGHRNWTWQDYMTSYVSEGKDVYERFKNLIEHFGFDFTTTLHYCCGDKHDKLNSFREGELVIKDQQKTFQLLKWYKEVTEAADHANTVFAQAMYQLMQHPEYDHSRMERKMNLYSSALKRFVTRADYLRVIEDIYNRGQTEETKRRLF